MGELVIVAESVERAMYRLGSWLDEETRVAQVGEREEKE